MPTTIFKSMNYDSNNVYYYSKQMYLQFEIVIQTVKNDICIM